MSVGHVFLVRHGRTALNAAGVLRGHLDPVLDEVGHVEAYELAAAITYSQPSRIVSSPLRRAVQTAEPVSLRTQVAIEHDQRLVDRDYGGWAGRTLQDVLAEHGSVDAAPGVESAETVVSRARAVLDEQTRYIDAGPVVLVAHDVVNRLLLASLRPDLGPPDEIPQRTGCWNVLQRHDDVWRVEQVDQRP